MNLNNTFHRNKKRSLRVSVYFRSQIIQRHYDEEEGVRQEHSAKESHFPSWFAKGVNVPLDP